MQIQIFNDTGEIAEAFARMLFELGNTPKRAIHIALSGGNTPKAIFRYLTEKYGTRLANQAFHFWWGDDRCVPPTHGDSNFKWANELWLQPIGIHKKNIHRILGENSPEEEASRYSKEIEQFVSSENGWPRFDLILLGLGEDGHTASIFPNQMEKLTSDKTCEVATHPVSGQRRITVTGHVLNNTANAVFISTGDGKKKMVYEVIKKQDNSLPASHIQPANGQLIWWIDKGAATFIEKTGT